MNTWWPKRGKEWGMNGWRNAVIVPLFNTKTGVHELDVTIFGLTKEEAMQVPCPQIHALARRYPNHHLNLFELRSTDEHR